MALVTYRLQDGVISEPRVAVGGVEPQPRRIEDAPVAELSIEITEVLRGEIRRHGQH